MNAKNSVFMWTTTLPPSARESGRHSGSALKRRLEASTSPGDIRLTGMKEDLSLSLIRWPASLLVSEGVQRGQTMSPPSPSSLPVTWPPIGGTHTTAHCQKQLSQIMWLHPSITNKLHWPRHRGGCFICLSLLVHSAGLHISHVIPVPGIFSVTSFFDQNSPCRFWRAIEVINETYFALLRTMWRMMYTARGDGMLANNFLTEADNSSLAPLTPSLLISNETLVDVLQRHENAVGSAPPRIKDATIPSRPSLAANLIKVDFSIGRFGFGWSVSSCRVHNLTIPNWQLLLPSM